MKISFVCFITFFAGISTFGQTLTNSNIFDYQIGDEFIICRYPPGPPTYTYTRILKSTNYNNDSILYIFNTKFIAQDANDFFKWKAKDSTYSITYKNLFDPYFNKFLRSDSVKYDTFSWDTAHPILKYRLKDTSYIDTCGSSINHRYRYYSYGPVSEMEITETTAVAGIGILKDYSSGPSPMIHNMDNLIYYKKGSISCGSKKELPVGITSIKFQSLKIYPNPVIDNITIGNIGKFSFSIINGIGKKIQEGNNLNESTVNVSELPSGFYILYIESSKGNTSATFVKQ